ncbi:MAG: aminotransferase class V-fold PLP-dependent enzyme [Ilumatobacter sp.]|nr:aminotransferase class V-fold PLP-dependent enzyme [Ilumatobacter sp.]
MSDALIATIRSSVIGATEMVEGPFGARPVVYADYTASGRSLAFIEEYISDVVLPLYANTHTESSGTGLQTSRFREDARAIIARCVGATDEHAVVFCGSGSTAAIAKIVGVLGIKVPSNLDDRFHLTDEISAERRPVVFIGPYEHHSNELPWRESIADVITIHETLDGQVDLDHLEAELERHRDRPQLIGSFSAASNVTGIVTDVRAVSSLLHRYGAIALWDYAAAAPYVSIDMGSPANGDDYLDAVFISPHKLIGGPGTPGLLVARRELFTNRVPDVPGGGTVAYVNPEEHDYLPDIEHREEGGTPDIVGSIRAGLVFQLKEAVGVDCIAEREERFLRAAIDEWDSHPNLMILGDHDAERLSIVSFVVRDVPAGADPEPGRYLHHNFVVSVLNDLFGIQSRGGCSCAGPYGHRLLGIDLERSHEFEREITRGCEGIKPGWVRVNFNYFIDDDTFRYVVDAVSLMADEGRKLLPYYRFEPATGLWRHRGGVACPPLSLADVSYETGAMSYDRRPKLLPEGGLAEYLDRARALLGDLSDRRPAPLGLPDTTGDFEHLRWFPYPDEVAAAR